MEKSFSFADATKIYQFKAKDSEIKKYPLCLGNASKDTMLQSIIWKKKTVLKRSVIFFSVDYRSINTNEILDIHTKERIAFLNVWNWYKCLELLRKCWLYYYLA